VTRGTSGTPGELHGQFQVHSDLGSLSANTASGIFGKLSAEDVTKNAKSYPLASCREIKIGKATILSNISGSSVEEYDVEILRVYSTHDQDTRDMMIKVTDPRLLETTGGIVQGMSGSPILQNGRIVGAVTHVLVNDPTRGYGIFIENMLEAAK
jgi:stage IV sporulation protein B